MTEYTPEQVAEILRQAAAKSVAAIETAKGVALGFDPDEQFLVRGEGAKVVVPAAAE